MSKNLPQGEVLLIPNMSTYLTLCVKLASPVRSAGGISPSAERDLRRCLKNLPPFEKGGRKLPAAVVFNLSEKSASFCPLSTVHCPLKHKTHRFCGAFCV